MVDLKVPTEKDFGQYLYDLTTFSTPLIQLVLDYCAPSPEGKFYRKSTSLGAPISVSLYNTNLILCQQDFHRIRILNYHNFQLQSEIGDKGSLPGYLTNPVASVVDNENHENPEMYISDWGNHRVQILDFLTGTFLRQIDKGILFPKDIKIAGDFLYVLSGMTGRQRVSIFHRKTGDLIRNWTNEEFLFDWFSSMYVSHEEIFLSGCSDHQVHVWSTSGKILRKIGGELLHFPTGLAVSGDEVYCADGNHRIAVLDRHSGKFLRSWGRHGNRDGDLWLPQRLLLTYDGDLVVADNKNNRLVVFR